MKKNVIKNIFGFSLVELAIALTIIAVLLGVSVTAFNAQLKSTSLLSTETKLEEVKFALDSYFERAGRYPCPADPALEAGNANFGIATTSCDSTCTGGMSCSGLMVRGDLPFETLGLTSEFAKDGYGNKISYVVDRLFTIISDGVCEASGRIQIIDYNGNVATNDAVYAIVSHGEDAAGARAFDTGLLKRNCNTGFKDGENCDVDTVYRISGLRLNTAAANDHYDDVVTWGLNPNRKICPAGLTKCYAWFDSADMCTIELGSGTDLFRWYDKSENPLNIILNQTNSSFRPDILPNGPKGFSYVRFNGSSDVMVFDGVTNFPQTDFTSISVFRNSTTSGTISAITNFPSYGGAASHYFRMSGSNVAGRIVYDSEYFSSGVTLNNNLPHFATLDISPNSPLKYYIDGNEFGSSSITTGAAFGNRAIVLGGSSADGGYYGGDVMEVLYFTPKLTNYELDLVHIYLREKWQQ